MSESIANKPYTTPVVRNPKTLKEYERSEAKERKRNILYLILSYLKEQNLQDTANTLANEAQLTNQFEVCDNVDLDIVLQDYQSYYITKFNKPPRIVKKVVTDEAMLSKTVQTQKKKSKSAFTVCSSEKVSQQKVNADFKSSANNQETVDNFQINVRALGREHCQRNDAPGETDDVLGYEERRSAKEFCDFKNYNQEWRDMADLIVKEIVCKDLGIRWSDCVGLERSIEVLKEAVVYPVRYPQMFTGLATPWKGVLLFGPPGTGKTQLAKATACESSTTFIMVRSSSFISKWRGDSEKMLKILFDMAKFYQPTTVFIDEIDSVASKYEDSQHDASRRFKSELLIEMDGIVNGSERVFVLATTNSPWNLDPALLRRFEKRILLNAPSKEARQELFRYFFSKHCHSFQEDDFSEMARLTESFSGSDIKAVCKEVVMDILREKLRNYNVKGDSAGNQIRKPSLQDVMQAVAKASATTDVISLEKYRVADELAKEAAADADDGTLLAYAFASEKTVKSAIAEESQREWQTRWENAANGRWTKRFIGDANKFGKLGVALSYQATQLVTGHGNFGAYLHRIGRRDSADCECGGEDTAGHVLFDCPYTEDWRSRTETEAINAGLRWPRNEGEISDDETAEWWTFFCSTVEKLDRLRHDN
ncbi:putative katanin p60 ATPase-containing subunit [Trypoxylus dichotomus]